MLCTAVISVDVFTHHPDLSSMLSCFLVPLCCLPEPPLVQQCALPWHERRTSRLQVRESAEINWGCHGFMAWKGDASEESKQGGNAVQPSGATPGEDQAQ